MSDSRRRNRNASDDESDLPSRIVTPRRSLFAEDSDPPERIDRVDETEPLEESDPDEEPFEDEEEPHPTRTDSPPAFPPSVLSSPLVPSSPIPPPDVSPSTLSNRRQENFRRWDWMPRILKFWRRNEQMPILPEVPNPYTPIPHLTQEPVHHTIPVLITRIRKHDQQIEELQQAENDRMEIPSEVELLKHQVSGVENDLTELRDTTIEMHNEGVEEVTRLRRQLEASQQRLSEVEQEMALVRADRDQLGRVTASTARMVELLEGMNERLG